MWLFRKQNKTDLRSRKTLNESSGIALVSADLPQSVRYKG